MEHKDMGHKDMEHKDMEHKDMERGHASAARLGHGVLMALKSVAKMPWELQSPASVMNHACVLSVAITAVALDEGIESFSRNICHSLFHEGFGIECGKNNDSIALV
jgi:hypothetical protein